MQINVPGTQLILDATGLDESMGKAQYMNDCLNFETAGARIRQAPGLNYCLAYMHYLCIFNVFTYYNNVF